MPEFASRVRPTDQGQGQGQGQGQKQIRHSSLQCGCKRPLVLIDARSCTKRQKKLGGSNPQSALPRTRDTPPDRFSVPPRHGFCKAHTREKRCTRQRGDGAADGGGRRKRGRAAEEAHTKNRISESTNVNAGIELPPQKNCFVCGTSDDDRIDIRYYWHEETSEISAEVTFGPLAQGPPDHVHGGATAAVLDEAMGICAWMAGHMVLAVNLNVDFKQMIPLASTLRVKSSLEKVHGRKIHAHASMEDESGQLLAQGRGLYLTVPPELVKNRTPGTYDNLSRYQRYIERRKTSPDERL